MPPPLPPRSSASTPRQLRPLPAPSDPCRNRDPKILQHSHHPRPFLALMKVRSSQRYGRRRPLPTASQGTATVCAIAQTWIGSRAVPSIRAGAGRRRGKSTRQLVAQSVPTASSPDPACLHAAPRDPRPVLTPALCLAASTPPNQFRPLPPATVPHPMSLLPPICNHRQIPSQAVHRST